MNLHRESPQPAESPSDLQSERDRVILASSDAAVINTHAGELGMLLNPDDVIATLREPFLVLNGALRVRMANRAFYESFHVTEEDTEGRFLYDLGDGQWDIPGLRNLMAEVLSQNQFLRDFEVQHTFPVLGPKTMLLNARSLPPGVAHPELILLAFEDITERRRAEAAVRDSEVRYRRLFETAKDGILILDAYTGKIVDANPFMTGLLGYEHHELLGKQLWQIGTAKDESENQAAFRELQEYGYIRYDHLALQTKSGKEAEVEVVSNVYQMGHQRVAQCNVRDISERRRLEQQTTEQAAALVDLHRRKDEFLAMLSHELRNPLAPIVNAVQLLRLQPRTDNPIQHDACSVLERQVKHLSDLVDDLLDVSRINTGRIQLRQERLAVGSVVARAEEMVRPLIEQRKQHLIVSVPAQPIWLYADPSRMEQVLVNLLHNAAKYTEEGGHVWLNVEQEGNEVALRVRDTGIGIAPELLPRIFELFTQGPRSLDRSQGGLGIGLCLVQRLVELHGGTVAAHSVVGEGSEFAVCLPVASPDSAQLPEVTEADQPTARPLRVLVVDDNVDTTESLAILLELSGNEVRKAYDGPTAVEAALEYQPDVVLLDIGLPGFSGFEVAQQIRQHSILENVVLVALTGYGQDSDRQHSHDVGFNHHLVKPADFASLQRILAAVTDQGGARGRIPGACRS